MVGLDSPCRLGRLDDCLELFCLLGLLAVTWRLCLLSPVLLPLLSMTSPAWDWGGVASRGTATLCLLPSPSVLVLVRITRELEPFVGCSTNIITSTQSLRAQNFGAQITREYLLLLRELWSNGE